MDAADTLRETFDQAAEETYRAAAAERGEAYRDWSSTYLWLAEHDQPALVDYEKQRLAQWIALARAAGVAEDKLPPEQAVAKNLESATMVFGFDFRPAQDSGFEMPRGGERQMTAALQLRDPFSPMHRGLDDWQDFTSDT